MTQHVNRAAKLQDAAPTCPLAFPPSHLSINQPSKALNPSRTQTSPCQHVRAQNTTTNAPHPTRAHLPSSVPQLLRLAVRDRRCPPPTPGALRRRPPAPLPAPPSPVPSPSLAAALHAPSATSSTTALLAAPQKAANDALRRASGGERGLHAPSRACVARASNEAAVRKGWGWCARACACAQRVPLQSKDPRDA